MLHLSKMLVKQATTATSALHKTSVHLHTNVFHWNLDQSFRETTFDLIQLCDYFSVTFSPDEKKHLLPASAATVVQTFCQLPEAQLMHAASPAPSTAGCKCLSLHYNIWLHLKPGGTVRNHCLQTAMIC